MSRPSVKVGINGFGRIGRITLRALIARQASEDRKADIKSSVSMTWEQRQHWPICSNTTALRDDSTAPSKFQAMTLL